MLDKIISIVAETLDVDRSEIKPDTDFKKDLDADSLDLFELVEAMEDKFDFDIPNEDAEKLTTVNAIAAYMKEKGLEQ